MQASPSSDSNDKVHVVLKRAKPAKRNEEKVEPSADPNPEKEAKNQKLPVQEEEPTPQIFREMKEENEAKPRSSSKPYLDGEDEPLDEFTYDANSF